MPVIQHHKTVCIPVGILQGAVGFLKVCLAAGNAADEDCEGIATQTVLKQSSELRIPVKDHIAACSVYEESNCISSTWHNVPLQSHEPPQYT